MAKSRREQRQASSGFDDRNAVSAALISAGFGTATMGIIQFIAELIEPFNDALALNKALGPYSGKYLIAYGAWLLSWAILYPIAGANKIRVKVALTITVILIVIGAILLFPPFISLFV